MDSGRPDKPPYRERNRAFAKHISQQDRHLLGDFLTSRRLAVGIEQGELASRLGFAQSVLSKIEKGHREVGVLEFVAICRELNLDPSGELRALVDVLPSNNKEMRPWH